MVIGAESVANDCQQKSQIMERLYRNHISKCTSNIHQHKKDSSCLSENTATEISSGILTRSIFSQKDKGKLIFEHLTNLGKHCS